jgi:hypothetical protein
MINVPTKFEWTDYPMPASVALQLFSNSRKRRCSAFAAALYRPCFVTARRMRSIPSAVFGPVLRPP